MGEFDRFPDDWRVNGLLRPMPEGPISPEEKWGFLLQ